MSLYHGPSGTTLLRAAGGGLAGNANCCCEEITACCPQFETEETAPATLTLTIVAPDCAEIDGANTTLDKTNPALYSDGSHPIGNCGSPISVGWTLECIGDGNSCEDWRLTCTRSSVICEINGGASHSIMATSCTCDPFELVFDGFIIDDSGVAPGHCDCCPGGLSVIITE